MIISSGAFTPKNTTLLMKKPLEMQTWQEVPPYQSRINRCSSHGTFDGTNPPATLIGYNLQTCGVRSPNCQECGPCLAGQPQAACRFSLQHWIDLAKKVGAPVKSRQPKTTRIRKSPSHFADSASNNTTSANMLCARMSYSHSSANH